jgi:hypothetical protein
MTAGVDAHTEARHGYIETQTKRALDRVGVDAVVTQDMELGRRMGGEEARALEGIVNAMTARQERDGDEMEEWVMLVRVGDEVTNSIWRGVLLWYPATNIPFTPTLSIQSRKTPSPSSSAISINSSKGGCPILAADKYRDDTA